mmetsp:Transcript_3319/g.10360  ORF Transcript_3319/g.10360 Transcript_3319/m.10360 type:complete len:309 (-) Transcript_3319:151-1077(-)
MSRKRCVKTPAKSASITLCSASSRPSRRAASALRPVSLPLVLPALEAIWRSSVARDLVTRSATPTSAAVSSTHACVAAMRMSRGPWLEAAVTYDTSDSSSELGSERGCEPSPSPSSAAPSRSSSESCALPPSSSSTRQPHTAQKPALSFLCFLFLGSQRSSPPLASLIDSSAASITSSTPPSSSMTGATFLRRSLTPHASRKNSSSSRVAPGSSRRRRAAHTSHVALSSDALAPVAHTVAKSSLSPCDCVSAVPSSLAAAAARFGAVAALPPFLPPLLPRPFLGAASTASSPSEPASAVASSSTSASI